ncbi:MAG: hypothetical protein EOM23_04825 [Candidatus Moranbacteria bacterium]|nr:hypothetical protein [Candidatus Moranbacteria bacterium]
MTARTVTMPARIEATAARIATIKGLTGILFDFDEKWRWISTESQIISVIVSDIAPEDNVIKPTSASKTPERCNMFEYI